MKTFKILTLALLIIFTNNITAQFAASNFSLMSTIDPETGTGIKYSGCWAWYDSINKKEYAIAGSKTGTYFIDVTNASTPSVSAFYPATASNGNWREMKTYKNYCYVVNDNGSGTTGLQIFDLSTLPTTVTLVSQNMTLFRRGHAAWIDGDKLYVSGITYSTGATSSMNVYSLATPTAPVLLRRLNQDYNFITYVHDAFSRNDTVFASCAYQGLYVFIFNTTTNTFSQVGSLTSYPGSGYNHSTALTPDGKTLIMLDEVPASLPIKVIDATNLANLQVLTTANQFTASTPHNPWIVNNQYCFISAYQDGTQLWDISNPSAPFLAGYFDTYPAGGGNNNNWSASAYNGQWGLYPFLPSKNIFALDRHNGVFMLNTHLFANPEIDVESNSTAIPIGSSITNTINNTDFGSVTMPGSKTHSFVINNTGLGSLIISNITLTGNAATDFSIALSPATLTILPSASQTINIIFSPATAGTRSAQVTLVNNDIDEGNYNFKIEGTAISLVGINSIELEGVDVKIFPNPANDLLNLNFNSSLLIKKVSLTNVLGQTLITNNINDLVNHITINVKAVPKGVYFLEIESDNHQIKTKIIVN